MATSSAEVALATSNNVGFDRRARGAMRALIDLVDKILLEQDGDTSVDRGKHCLT